MGRVVKFARPAPQRKPLNAWWPRYTKSTLAALAIGAVVVGGVGLEFGFRAAGCDIKGNIGDGGERIFHVPGQKYYSATRISFLKGERWFCSEQAARKAGWRRALL